MKLKIEGPDEFRKLFNKLLDELIEAKTFFELHTNLSRSELEYQKEFEVTGDFWGIIYSALKDAILLHLCRAYDSEEKSNSLINLLETIEANVDTGKIFPATCKPDIALLKNDLDYVGTEKNERVKNLIVWRGNLVAHRNAKNLARDTNIGVKNPFDSNDMSVLIDKGIEILNRYNLLFWRESASSQIQNYDDYKYLLDCIRLALKQKDEDLRALIGS